MLVCAHGNVNAYCELHDMHICDSWNGEITKYSGVCRVIVTDADISEAEYYLLKGEMLGKGYELISTRYTDTQLMAGYLVHANNRHKEKYRGRRSSIDADKIQKIRELKAAGYSIRAIRDTEGICHSDGRKFSVSTIQKITKKEKE